MYDESVELYEQGVAARVTVVRGDPRQRPANPRGCRQPLAAPPTQPAPPAHQHPLVLATLGASRGRPPAVSAPPTSSSTPLFPPESKDRRRTGRYPHPQSPGLRGGAGLMAGASRRRAASNGCALLALLLLLIGTPLVHFLSAVSTWNRALAT